MNNITNNQVEKIASEFDFQKGELNFDKDIPSELKSAIYDENGFKDFMKNLKGKFSHETV